MIKIQNTEVCGWRMALKGMRNPKNSWVKSDSEFFNCDTGNYIDILTPKVREEFMCELGPNDKKLAMTLAKAGTTHSKYRRMITVYCDITAPLYWWKEFDTYKVGTVANSCSTMHKIQDKRFDISNFSVEHLQNCDESHWIVCMANVIAALNVARDLYLKTGDKQYWWQMIQLLPSSYNQTRTVMMNYEVLAGIYPNRKDHKLDEWHEFCDWIKTLPYSELITLEEVTE